MTLLIRLGIPETTGVIPTAARRLGAAVMVSAGALWVPDGERFRLPGARCNLLDMALDSSGFVRHASQGGYPWSVAQYVELAWLASWSWWSQMDLPCEQQIAPNRAEVLSRVDRSADLFGECLAEARRVRSESGPTSLAAQLRDPVPVLQGRLPEDYARSAERVAVVCGGDLPSFVGVGSLCTRPVSGSAGVLAVLKQIDEMLPRQVRLHLFGVKGDAIGDIASFDRVASVDSMAWDFRARAASNERWAVMTDGQKELARRTRTRNPSAHRLEHMRRWYQRQLDLNPSDKPEI